jgi:hypothetical protein
MPSASIYPNPKVGVAHQCRINLDGDTVTEHQWYYTDTLSTQGITIAGATGEKYTPTADLVGKYLGCLVQFQIAGEYDAGPGLPEHQIKA